MDAGDDGQMLKVPETQSSTSSSTSSTTSDYDSPGPASPLHRAATAFCRRCHAGVGHFFNSWIQVTGSYYLPALLGSYSSTLSAVGRQKSASMGTELDGW
jgi:hypothetical protein